MVTGKNMVYLFVAVALTAAAIFFLFPNREKEVKKQLHRLTEYATKQQDEPTLTSLKKSALIGTLFTKETVHVRTPELEGDFTRKELSDRISMARNSFSNLKVSFYDISMEFPDKTTADVLLTMRLLGKMRTEEMSDVREVRMEVQKQEGTWLLTEVEFIEVLDK